MKLLLLMLLLFTGDIFCQLKNNRARIQFKSPQVGRICHWDFDINASSIVLTLINEQSDTLFICNACDDKFSLFLPLRLDYKGQHFYCYDPEISNFIHQCLPEASEKMPYFDHRKFIFAFAQYLYRF